MNCNLFNSNNFILYHIDDILALQCSSQVVKDREFYYLLIYYRGVSEVFAVGYSSKEERDNIYEDLKDKIKER